MKNRLKTIDGKPATRRIKWYQPTHEVIDGQKRVDIFVILELSVPESPQPMSYSVAYAGGQLGIDKKNRMVIPGGKMINPDLQRTACYHLGAVVGHIPEAAEIICKALNDSLAKTSWWAPAGLTRRLLSVASTASESPVINEMEIAP